MSDFLILALVVAPIYAAYVFWGDEMGKILSTGASKSKPFSLDGTDLWKLFVGCFVAGSGAFLTTFTESIGDIDFGEWTPHVTAGAAVLVNIARKFLADNT